LSEEKELRERAAGCLLGLAVGDALGAPFEFYGKVTDLPQEFKSYNDLPAGSFTDDTQMSIATAESILACGKLDPDDLAKRFAEMMPDIRGIGKITYCVLRKIREGHSWKHATEAAHLELGGKSAGNGAIMRIAPIAIAYWNDIPALSRAAESAAGVIHHDKLSHDAAAAVAQLIALLLSGATFIEQALAAVEVMFLEKAPQVARALREGATARENELSPQTCFVLDSLTCVVWSLLEGKDYMERVHAAIRIGGDTDTHGAITGAVSGASTGVNDIPANWREVERASDILRLADKLVDFSLSRSAV